MNDPIIYLDADLLEECQNWLAEIENALKYCSRWIKRLLKQVLESPDPKLGSYLTRMDGHIEHLLKDMPEFSALIAPAIVRLDLINMIFEIRTPINGINGYVGLIRSSKYGELSDSNKQIMEKIGHYSDLLFMLTQEPEPIFRAMNQDKESYLP